LNTKRRHRKSAGYWRWLWLLAACPVWGCLPDNALRQVLGENMLLTSAVVVQTVTSQFFNTLFGA